MGQFESDGTSPRQCAESPTVRVAICGDSALGAVMADDVGAHDIIQAQLSKRLAAVGTILRADAIAYSGPIEDRAERVLKRIIESIDKRKNRLVVILETGGGLIEAAELMANTFRYNYRYVDFVIPWQAMSAGTVLAMVGDNIYMDYASVLGPIDPQVMGSGGAWVPALGYLEQYERLVSKSAAGDLTNAEMAYLLQNFDPAEMYKYEQAKDLSRALLKEWLAKYKFRGWKVTETTKTKVTPTMRRDRAEDVANKLLATDRWHSHSRGISMEVLRRELKLKIEDYGANKHLREAVKNYTDLLVDYRLQNHHHYMAVNWRDGYHGF